MVNELKHYEFSFIIPGNLSETDHPKIFENLQLLLTKNEVKNITPTIKVGRKKLAYPIKTLRHGFYFTWEFDLLPNNLLTVEKELRINKNILRYLILTKHIKTAEEIAREEKVKEIQIKEQLKKEKDAVTEKKIKPEKKKVSLDDLDKKLDELLSKDIK